MSNILTICFNLIAYKESGVEPSGLYQKYGIKPDEIKERLNTLAELMKELEGHLNSRASWTRLAQQRDGKMLHRVFWRSFGKAGTHKAGTAAAFPLQLRLHYKAVGAGGVSRHGVCYTQSDRIVSL